MKTLEASEYSVVVFKIAYLVDLLTEQFDSSCSRAAVTREVTKVVFACALHRWDCVELVRASILWLAALLDSHFSNDVVPSCRCFEETINSTEEEKSIFIWS
jgi:hypothetical protein